MIEQPYTDKVMRAAAENTDQSGQSFEFVATAAIVEQLQQVNAHLAGIREDLHAGEQPVAQILADEFWSTAPTTVTRLIDMLMSIEANTRPGARR